MPHGEQRTTSALVGHDSNAQYNYPRRRSLLFFSLRRQFRPQARKDVHPHTMQDRSRSFLDIKSLFQSSRRSRSATPAKTYHYKKKEWSSNGPKQSTVTDEHTTYIIQRTLIDPHLSNETSVFRQLSVREPPPSPHTRQTSSRSPRSSNDSYHVFHSDAMSSADSLVTISPAQFPASPRSESPQLSQRRGGISSPDLTPRLHPPSGLTAPPFSHVPHQTQNITPRRLTPDKGDISYSRPTPFAYPFVKSRRSSQQNGPSAEWQPSQAPGPRVPEPIEPSFALHSPQRGGSGRPATNHGYRDRMLVHASVNKTR